MIDWKPIAEKFREADAILIGASNGLSITEGLHLFADNIREKSFGLDGRLDELLPALREVCEA